MIDLIKAKICQFKYFFSMPNQNFQGKIKRFPFLSVWNFITTPLIKKTLFEKFLNSIGNLDVSSGRYILQWNIYAGITLFTQQTTFFLLTILLINRKAHGRLHCYELWNHYNNLSIKCQLKFRVQWNFQAKHLKYKCKYYSYRCKKNTLTALDKCLLFLIIIQHCHIRPPLK